MTFIKVTVAVLGLCGLVGGFWLLWPPGATAPFVTQRLADPQKGQVLLQAAGCYACHTQDVAFAGGLKLDSPFGDFYSPNITLDPEQGIGGWTLADFSRAVRQGIAPDSRFYYPVMPFSAYQSLSDQDVVDMWAALKEQPVQNLANLSHELTFPFGFRPLLKGWRLLFFNPSSEDLSDRGAYLAEAVLHCSECHTPRNLLGGLQRSKKFQGNDQLPDQNVAPDIRAEVLKAEGWTAADLNYLLVEGMLPSGDYVGGSMVEVTDEGTAYLSDEDRAALVAFLLRD